MPEFAGLPSGVGRRVVVLASRFNEPIVKKLVEGAMDALVKYGVEFENIDVVWVPGAWELPMAARWLLSSERYDGLVAVGAVIRGETAHFDFIAGEASRGLAATLTSRPKRELAEPTATRAGTRPSQLSKWLTCATDWSPKMRIESRARARALQALYACDMRGGKNLDRVASQVWDDLSVAPEERRLAGLLVRAVVSGGPGLDSKLADVTTNWRLERLGAIERSVLRLGAAELMEGDTPPRVAIQEAVRLAERFGTSASAKFVNGVLDAFARQAGMI
jgi:transcription antitermination factor NusB/6,7-dimethyl-8-ribityllumazine synthase